MKIPDRPNRRRCAGIQSAHHTPWSFVSIKSFQ